MFLSIRICALGIASVLFHLFVLQFYFCFFLNDFVLLKKRFIYFRLHLVIDEAKGCLPNGIKNGGRDGQN